MRAFVGGEVGFSSRTSCSPTLEKLLGLSEGFLLHWTLGDKVRYSVVNGGTPEDFGGLLVVAPKLGIVVSTSIGVVNNIVGN